MVFVGQPDFKTLDIQTVATQNSEVIELFQLYIFIVPLPSNALHLLAHRPLHRAFPS
jgi:hypothetical protein